MGLEETLKSWTAPSSESEQEKQDRTERAIKDAVGAHAAFANCALSVYAKGSYANNTNVRADSDVDIAVECTELEYWEEATPGARSGGAPYTGSWTPEKLRSELSKALVARFPSEVDASASTAFKIKSTSTRVEADVVPCFSYRYYVSSEYSRTGTMIFSTSGKRIINYPRQQIENGTAKNTRTGLCYKRAVRVLKRVENAMLDAKVHREVPSFFMECLAYNCPDSIITLPTWTSTVQHMLAHIWEQLQGDEPAEESRRWLESNGCKFLFHSTQKWTRADGRDFVQAAWNYLGFN